MISKRGVRFLTFAALLLFVNEHLVNASTDISNACTGILPCDTLISAGLKDRVLLPTTTDYEILLDSFWSYNTRSRPWCFVQPRTADEVALALTTLVNVNDGAGDWYIAVRSGGHSLAASNNIENGVTIDVSLINGVTYNPDTDLASVGPGGKWNDVLKTLLDEYNVSVVGGRDGDVGVGGFLTGGGISYYSPRKGFACDNVASMQVVLANGTIVTASNDEHYDLFTALKGGSLNAGIVTRFDLEAFPAQNVTYGQQVMALDHTQTFSKAMVDFASAQGPNDVLIPTWTRMPSLGNETIILAIKVNTVNDANTAAFREIDSIPAIDDTGMVSMTLADAAAISEIDSGMRTFWRTATYSNKVSIVKRCVDLHEQFANELATFLDPSTFSTLMVQQPFPKAFITASQQKGRNILGLEHSLRGDAILWTGGVQLDPNKTTEANFAKAQALVNRWAARLEQYAQEVDGLEKYVALNYADASQDPLKSYGRASVEFLRSVAARYDPAGVFQTRVPGGFKISRVLV